MNEFRKSHRIAFQAAGFEWSMIAEALEHYANENSDFVDTTALLEFVDAINKKLGFE